MDLKEFYEKKVVPEFMKRQGFSSKLAVPRLEKIVINVGLGRIREDKERDNILRELALISGQKGEERPAKKSIASFKSRQGMTVGARVTLRGRRMYDFLSRLINIALPRTRDFRGLPSSSVDQDGNLTIGLREHIVFPEIIGEDVRNIFGLEATLVINAKSRDQALELYKLLGLPLK